MPNALEKLNACRFSELTLMAPGPHALSPAVTRTLSEYRATYTHRSSEFKACYARATELLREVFHIPGTHRPLIFGHTGSYNWEMVAVNTPDDFRTLSMDIGSFSKRWGRVLQERGRDVDVLKANPGDGITPEMLSAAMADPYDLVLLIHNETATGVGLDIQALADAVRRRSAETFIGVDAVSVAGAIDVNIGSINPDYYLWSLQKDFAIPTIGSVMVVSERALTLAKEVANRGYVLDLVEWNSRAENNQTPMTVADLTLKCLIARLEEMQAEGDTRFARHRALTDMQHAWAAEHGLGLLSKPGFESPSLSTIAVPDGITGPQLVAAAKAHLNVQIAPGYGSTADRYIRIAAMGTTTIDEMRRLLDGLTVIIQNWSEVGPTSS